MLRAHTGHTCGEPNEIETDRPPFTGLFYRCALGHGADLTGDFSGVFNAKYTDVEDVCPWETAQVRVSEKGGNVFRVGIFVDFVRLTTRTMHPPWGVRAGSQTKSN